MSPAALVFAWEREHSDLDLHWTQKFLAHPDIPSILKYPAHEIRAAITHVTKLDELLTVLRGLAALERKRIEAGIQGRAQAQLAAPGMLLPAPTGEIADLY